MEKSSDCQSLDCGNPQSSHLWEGIRRIANARLSTLDTIVDDVLQRVVASIPQYLKIPEEDLRSAVVTNVRGALVGLEEQRLPTRAELTVHEGLIEGRVYQRLPLEAILSAFQVGGQAVWGGVEQQARRENVETGAILAAAKLMWNRIDMLMTSAAVAYRQAELSMVSHDQQRQSDFLRDLLLGDPDSAELGVLAPACGLSLDRSYVCFRARATEDIPLHHLRRILTAGMPNARSGLIGIIQGDLVGLLPGIPQFKDTAVTVGIGPPRKLSSLNTSFLLASRALETAFAFRMTGVFSLEDVALRAAILADEFVGNSLADRYLLPLLNEKTAVEDLASTVKEFLDRGMRVDSTARALHVHPNTLRNRLHRFEEKTGADLSRVEDIVGIWWALERCLIENQETAD